MRTLLLLACLLVSTMTMGCVVQARGGAYARTNDGYYTDRSRTTTVVYREPARPVVYRSTTTRPAPYRSTYRSPTTRPTPYRSTYSRPNSARPSPITSRPGAKCPPGHRWSDGQCHSTGKGNDPNKGRGKGKGKVKVKVEKRK